MIGKKENIEIKFFQQMWPTSFSLPELILKNKGLLCCSHCLWKCISFEFLCRKYSRNPTLWWTHIYSLHLPLSVWLWPQQIIWYKRKVPLCSGNFFFSVRWLHVTKADTHGCTAPRKDHTKCQLHTSERHGGNFFWSARWQSWQNRILTFSVAYPAVDGHLADSSASPN